MSAISGVSSAYAAAQVYGTVAVRPVRPVTSNADRAELAQADRFEASGAQPPIPQVTYGRNGQGGGSWGGGSPNPQQQARPAVDADHDGDSA